MRNAWILAGLAMLAAGCVDSKSPLAPTAIPAPTPPLAAPPLPTTVPGVLALAMPLEPGDSANNVIGIAPFGYHSADHAADGHTGWDIEYRTGGIVRAAAAGTVESVFPDALAAGRFTVQIAHVVGAHHYRTTYESGGRHVDIAKVLCAPDSDRSCGHRDHLSHRSIRPGVVIRMTLFAATTLRLPRIRNRTCSEPFLMAGRCSTPGRARYLHEVVRAVGDQPARLRSRPRDVTRRKREDGGVRFTRRTATGPDVEYEISQIRTVIEAGRAPIVATRPYPFIDLISPTAVRVGIYDALSNEMRLSLTTPGSQRPLDLSAASVYRTTR